MDFGRDQVLNSSSAVVTTNGQRRAKSPGYFNLANQAPHCASYSNRNSREPWSQPGSAQATLKLTTPDNHSNPTFSSLTSSFQAKPSSNIQLTSLNILLRTSSTSIEHQLHISDHNNIGLSGQTTSLDGLGLLLANLSQHSLRFCASATST